mgnify:FL=1|tara:strand:+ start:1886 stop:2407 length:522 start_codon:yes stop_codon:yes gene_type:complete
MPRKLILIGPESTGKTTLSIYLAKLYNFDLIKEYSRTYLSKKSNSYSYEDLKKIAIQQNQIEKESSSEKIIMDTDLITIKIWSEFKYGSCDTEIEKIISSYDRKKRYYLLLKDDIKWEYDPLRENKNDRSEIFSLHKNLLEKKGFDYSIIRGIAKNRIDNAIKVVEERFLSKN